MKKINFNKAFPSLGITVDNSHCTPGWSMWTMEKLLEDIDKHCLDKSRVKYILGLIQSGSLEIDDAFKELDLQ